MRLTFLGVRGSTPAPGAQFVEYGGHTSCVAVAPDPHSLPVLALDAGTGLRAMSGLLGGAPFRGSILLSHLHWDHVQGIPFFVAGDRLGAEVHVVMPAQLGRSGRDLLAQLLSPPAFPITPEGLAGSWTFQAREPGRFPASGFTVDCCEVSHKGGRTYAYRVSAPSGATVAYVPDHAPAAGTSRALRELLADVDVLIHDAQFVASEAAMAQAYGHATIDDALLLADQVRARSVVLFHHGPARTDAELDDLAAGLGRAVPALLAREGMVLDLP